MDIPQAPELRDVPALLESLGNNSEPVICALQDLSPELVWNNDAAPCLPWDLSPKCSPLAQSRPGLGDPPVALLQKAPFILPSSTHPRKSLLWLLGCAIGGFLWQNPAAPGMGSRDGALQNLGQIRNSSKDSSGLGFLNADAALQTITGTGQRAIPAIFTSFH